jgi:hypothetical protein
MKVKAVLKVIVEDDASRDNEICTIHWISIVIVGNARLEIRVHNNQ